MFMLTRVSGVFSPSVPNQNWPSFLSWPPFLICDVDYGLSQPLQIVVDVKRTEDHRSAAHGSTWEIWWVWYLIGRLAFFPKRAVVQDQIGRVHPPPGVPGVVRKGGLVDQEGGAARDGEARALPKPEVAAASAGVIASRIVVTPPWRRRRSRYSGPAWLPG